MISSLHSTLTSLLEISINRVLPLDPEYQNKLKGLSGKVIAISFTDLNLDMFFIPGEKQFAVLSSFEGEADVKLSGKSWGFFHMGLNNLQQSNNSAENKHHFESTIRFEGDVATGQRFEKLFAELNIDWEEALSDVTGDIFAHQAVNVAKKAGDWLKDIFESSHENFTEYVQEEVRLSPTKIEVENFFDDINELKIQLEDVELKFQQLTQRLAQTLIQTEAQKQANMSSPKG